MKVDVLPPANTIGSGPIDISPDGRRLAFVAAGPGGRTKLYVRDLDSLEARALPATEGAGAPFFSPDGRSVAFFADRKLKRIDLAGGPPQVLADAADSRGGSWGAGQIVFSPQGGGPLFRVSPAGGAVFPVTSLAASPKEVSHRWPHFLPDGKHFVFMNRRATAPHRLALELASIDGGKRAALADATSGASFARGRLHFLRGTTLLAQPFDPDRGALSGEPTPVTDQVWIDPDTDGYCAFALSADGTLAFRGGAVSQYQMTWLDRQGHPVGTVGSPGAIVAVTLSPDGRQAAFYSLDPDRDRSLVQTIDLAQGAVSLISDQASAQAFSPDGRTVVFASDLKGVFDLYQSDSHGSGSARLLLANDLWKFPESWSPDGRFLTFSQSKPVGAAGDSTDIWILPIAENGKAFPFRPSSGQQMYSAFSPDGRFIAYSSDESGVLEVYVQTFPATEAKWRVSSGGGSEPVWSRDGSELFYVAPSTMSGRRTLMTTSVHLSGHEFSADPPRPLFDAALRGRGSSPSWPYAVSPDGQRFLAVLRVGESDASPIVLFTSR
jgi:Tol biopolymer transport system component